ncbi:MAG: dephospho-CoA kinase [Actinomycetia bacterium]|nr:dephospho-CoA kinase [Actinomycetes bacterium]MCP3910122.1 dephospho-CoA kinase [Actinomycetes bacterium]
MRYVALTGGIGSGKSTVSARLAELEAAIIDADGVARDLQKPGGAAFEAMVGHFGDGIVGDDGELDRPSVATLVFNDKEALATLNKLVGPLIRTEIRRRATELAHTDGIVILDIPLLAEGEHVYGNSATAVIDIPTETAVLRLVEFRGMERDDAEARIRNQASREDRLALANFVIDNSGSPSDLEAEIQRCWQWMQGLEQTEWPPHTPSADDAES